MAGMTWRGWLVVVGTAILVGSGTFLGWGLVQQWRQDTLLLRAVVQLLNYNVAQGRLALEPVPTAPGPVAPRPDSPKQP